MDIAGSAILDRLRPPQAGPSLPVIALTRRGDLKTKLAAFERGVDDILTVPFSPEEFVARTLAVMRRTYREGGRIHAGAAARRSGDRHPEPPVSAPAARSCTSPRSSRACSICWPPTPGACSPATRSWTTSGAPTTWPRATWSTATSATCAASCRTIPSAAVHRHGPRPRLSLRADNRRRGTAAFE